MGQCGARVTPSWHQRDVTVASMRHLVTHFQSPGDALGMLIRLLSLCFPTLLAVCAEFENRFK